MSKTAVINVIATFIAATSPSFAQIATAPPTPEWIAASGSVANQQTVFQRTFQVQGGLLKAILLGACEGEMSVEVNGAVAGTIAGRERASGLDLTRMIHPGTNVLAIRARNAAGPARISVFLELNGDLARNSWVVTDSTWRSSVGDRDTPLQSLGRVDAEPNANPFDPKKAFDAYNSWKLALGTNTATDPATFTLRPGFKAELLRSAQPGEGSWVGMAFDPKGRLTIAREARGLLRMSLGRDYVEHVEVIDDTLLECRGLLYAHDSLYVNANNSKGFYRLRDTRGEDRFDEVKCLLRTKGGVGHGRNHVVLGPDGAIWLVHGNDVTLAENITTNSPLQNYKNDSLIPCPFDDALFDGGVLLPAGHILRTDADGTRFELFAGGFRNPLDIAFNRDGEMFTFDADMEWDVGSPWYRPNRVNHVIAGADFGWRRGTSKWPDYLPDTLPTTLNIGLASPTGIEFGTRSHFPPPYNDALFLADWAYGRVLAVHLTPKGASYSATSELFLSGRPLNVTDFTFGPDGAMYLITGGRGTQSGLYRISSNGPKPSVPLKTAVQLAQEKEAAVARKLRRQLESLFLPPSPLNGVRAEAVREARVSSKLSAEEKINFLWPHLGHSDPWIRHAARTALEHTDVSLWQSRALSEKQTDVALTSWLALGRFGNRELQRALLERLNQLSWNQLNEPQELRALRVYEIACSRMGRPDADLAEAMRSQFEVLYPARDWQLNHRLCALLVYLESPQTIPRTLALIEKADAPEDLMQYLFYLRYVRTGWTLSQREAYFAGLRRAEQKQGARDYYSVLKRVRDDVISSLNTNEVQLLARAGALSSAEVPSTRKASSGLHLKFVREWKLADFDLTQPLRGRSAEKGREVFYAAQCSLCHRFGNEGGLVGPDLTSVASRFDRRAILESILEPSKVIDDKYRNTSFTLKDGSSVVGIIERDDEQGVLLRESPFSEKPIELRRNEIDHREPSPISPMPTGLLDVLQREQILDLLAFLQSVAKN